MPAFANISSSGIFSASYEGTLQGRHEWRGTSVAVTIHNPDRYMADLRTIVAQGRKRIGFLIGAGAAAGLASPGGVVPLIPAVDGLTAEVLKALEPRYGAVIGALRARLPLANVETILSRVRSLAGVIGDGVIDGLNGEGLFRAGAERMRRNRPYR
jgi:hypothetical protein